tara:strand:- start:1588 stop:2646 length:1059 start_codon:yes stop_codon:yes gene_type:complete
MTFTHRPYRGDIAGELTLLVYNDGKFIRETGIDATTSEYVSAGGSTFASLTDLNPFKANIAYLNYTQTTTDTSTVKTTTSGLFSSSSSGLGYVGNGSSDFDLGKDPRISHRVAFAGGSTNGLGVTGPTFMTQLVITDENTNATFDCYFSRFFDGSTTGTTQSIEICLVGVSGGVSGDFIDRTGPFTFMAPGGHTSSTSKDNIISLKNVNSFREFVKDQIGASLDGATFNGITYGAGKTGFALFIRGSTDLTELATIRTLVQANLKQPSSGNTFSTIHLPFVHDSITIAGSNFPAPSGVTFNASTGGCGDASEFDDAVGQLFKERFDAKTSADAQIRTVESLTTIRAICNSQF